MYAPLHTIKIKYTDGQKLYIMVDKNSDGIVI